MEITIEYLQVRLREFQQQKEDAISQLGACGGAIQFCTFLISELEKGGGEKVQVDLPSPTKEK